MTSGFLIIIAKLSDIFGRKNFIVLVLGSFIAFSIGCGFSNDMTTLIVVRAFQGIGGGGMYAMAFIVLPEMVPISKHALYTAILASTIALAGLSGPLIGGTVNRNHDNTFAWRWIFLLKESSKKWRALTVENFKSIDVIGLLLLLGASILFVTALEKGGTRYSWYSVITLSLLIISFVLWVLFWTWEWYQSNHETKQEPLGPHLRGAAMTTVIINLPQRFHVVNGNSPLEAGYRLLALTISIPFGSFIGGFLVQKLCIPFIWVLMGFAPLQIAGLVLLGFSSSNKDISRAIYGYQVVAGLGLGGSLGVSIMMIPFIATKQDMATLKRKDFEDQRVIRLAAVGMSGSGQFRALGGSIGIAICTNVLNNHITSALSSILSPIQLNELLQSTEVLTKFPPRLLAITRKAYSDAYNTQMLLLAAFSAATLMTTVLFWERTPRRMTKS
ncbi:putative mfs multidrug transporter protein [Botrytis fragariae]|uniref:Putative mfs multidrug transporter protein n=1 Tax=Botrytis fragariae TaxID=1964551 RepID=A0A8H6AJU9_9HELO|nr:putative mfs multidrug transporter protein [Botrytis fragariae]KAF5868961.1 putative mfs multidrug transporter protein [Botrytis fragariae]